MTHTSTRRGLAVFAILGVVALGSTTACASGSGTTPVAGSSSGTGATPPPVTGTVPVPSPTTSPSPSVNPGGPMSGPPSGVPSGIKATGYTTSGTTLTVTFFAGVCAKYSLLADQSTAGEVKVTVISTPTASTGMMCPQLIRAQTASAVLSAPLNGRTVLDTVSGAHVPLTTALPGGRMTHGPVKS